jgi:hypothetical protein
LIFCYLAFMTNAPISNNNALARAAERVRASREAERAGAVVAATPLVEPQKTTTKVRARLNHVPDDETLGGMIGNALAALTRGVRWARGSILNLLV